MADLVLQALSVSVPARLLSGLWTVPALSALTVPVPVLQVQDGVAPAQVPQLVAAPVVVSGHYPSA